MKNKLPYLLPVFLLVLAVGSFVITGKTIKNTVSPVCGGYNQTGEIDPMGKTAYFEGRNFEIPKLAYENVSDYKVLGSSVGDKWIEIDLSEQKLRAWENGNLYLETLISSGLPYYPTPTGEFRIWIKLRATKMEGGSGRYYYNLPNVPYVMFFENSEVPGWRGFGLHGTYWHSDFGTRRSHGCVNLPTTVAQTLYNWTDPALPNGANIVRSSADNPGTRIIIHE